MRTLGLGLGLSLGPALCVLLATTGMASAHAVFGFTGFSGGLLHPLLVPTHILALAALALLIGQQGWGPSVPIVYVVAVLAGLGAIALAFVPRLAEETLLALAAFTGLTVALARPQAENAGRAIAAAVGLALALDSPPESISLAMPISRWSERRSAPRPC
jgi:urease accessory protein